MGGQGGERLGAPALLADVARLVQAHREVRLVAVVGIDDIEDGHFSTPSLTTISPDKAQIANLVVELLLSRIKEGNSKPPREVQADFTLVVRESSLGRVANLPMKRRPSRQARA